MRTETDHEIEDLALLFVEEEVGRFDWRANWQKMRSENTGLLRVKAWLSAIKSNHDPAKIIEFLDRMVQERSGHWS